MGRRLTRREAAGSRSREGQEEEWDYGDGDYYEDEGGALPTLTFILRLNLTSALTLTLTLALIPTLTLTPTLLPAARPCRSTTWSSGDR